MALDVFTRTNQERQLRGLAPFAWDGRSAVIAQEWAEEMQRTGYRHRSNLAERFNQAGFVGSIGENIAVGYRSSAQVHDAWMKSDGHRHNLLNPGFTGMGVGIVCRSDGTMMAVENFVGQGYDPALPAADPRATTAGGGINCG